MMREHPTEWHQLISIVPWMCGEWQILIRRRKNISDVFRVLNRRRPRWRRDASYYISALAWSVENRSGLPRRGRWLNGAGPKPEAPFTEDEVQYVIELVTKLWNDALWLGLTG